AVGENEGGNPDRAAPQDPLHALEIQRRALLAPQPYDVDREEGHRIAAQYCALGDDLGLYAEYASEAEQLQYGEHRAQSDGRDFHAAKTLFTGRVRKAKREYQEAGIAGALRHRLQQFLDEKDRRVVLQMGVEHEILAGIEPHHVEEEAGRHRTRLCPGELERAPDDEDSDDLVQCEEKLAGPVLWRHGGRADRHRDRRGLRLVVPMVTKSRPPMPPNTASMSWHARLVGRQHGALLIAITSPPSPPATPALAAAVSSSTS